MKTPILMTLLMTLAGTVSAQFTIVDWTFDAGGLRSTSAVYAVSGSIGQPAGGTQRSASYQLIGGYSGLVGLVPSTPEAPTLRLVPAAREILLAWPSTARGFRLEQTPQLTRPDWTAVSVAAQLVGDEYQVRLPWQPGDRFFRLRQP